MLHFLLPLVFQTYRSETVFMLTHFRGWGECGFSKTAGYFCLVSVSNEAFSFGGEMTRGGTYVGFGQSIYQAIKSAWTV